MLMSLIVMDPYLCGVGGYLSVELVIDNAIIFDVMPLHPFSLL